MPNRKTGRLLVTLFALVACAKSAHAAQSLQMLPPVPLSNPAIACAGGSPAQLLAYSGNADGAINCMPGTIDTAGNVTILGNSTFNGVGNFTHDLNINNNVAIGHDLTIANNVSIAQNLVVGGTITVTGQFNLSNNNLSINGQNLSDTTIHAANSLAIALANCPRGGTLTVDGGGNITCTSTTTSTSFYMTVTGNWTPIVNPVTGSLSCPAGTVDRQIYWFSSGGDNHVFTLHSCTAS